MVILFEPRCKRNDLFEKISRIGGRRGGGISASQDTLCKSTYGPTPNVRVPNVRVDKRKSPKRKSPKRQSGTNVRVGQTSEWTLLK